MIALLTAGVLAFLKEKKHILFVVAVLLIIAIVILHVVLARSIYKAGGFSVRNPLSYVMIGGFLVLVVLKVKYLRRIKGRIEKHLKE